MSRCSGSFVARVGPLTPVWLLCALRGNETLWPFEPSTAENLFSSITIVEQHLLLVGGA